MNNLAPMKNCPGGGGVQGNLNWMPGYYGLVIILLSHNFTSFFFQRLIIHDDIAVICHFMPRYEKSFFLYNFKA